jgi:hypothetical protein
MYLLFIFSKQNELDGVHNVRAAFGNGLRMDIWEEFKNRFKIPRIIEFFGATEGTGSFVNITGTVGAIGRMSPLMVNHISINTLDVTRHYRYYHHNLYISFSLQDIYIHIFTFTSVSSYITL